jgi:heme exporter protein D
MAVYVRLEVDMGVVQVCGLIVHPVAQQKVQIMMGIARRICSERPKVIVILLQPV